MEKAKKTIDLLIHTFPDSKFDLIKEEWISTVEHSYPNIPENLKYLYRNLGYGTIGNSYYSIHVLLEPSDIYDQETAIGLKGKYIVGDNFCGDCHAYDADNNWTFGYINSNGEFIELTECYTDFIDFLEKLAINEQEETS